ELISVQIGETSKQFRRLREGDVIQENQLLALVDDTLARADVDIKVAKLEAAKADAVAAVKTRDEARERYNTQERLMRGGKGGLPATTMEDYRGALLTYNRYVEEAVSKEQAVKVAEQELAQARKTLSMYEIRPKISGTVKEINKHKGEAVKSLDAVFKIQNYDHLRVDALLQEQYANHLAKGMEVVIEPTLRESPTQTLVGHRGVVTGVAVSKDPKKPLIVSCSNDRTLRVWDLSAGEGRVRESRILRSAAPVRAVACTPPSAAANLCLSGDDQGKGLIWDLNDPNKPPLELKGQHRGGITAVAFSPDGRT